MKPAPGTPEYDDYLRLRSAAVTPEEFEAELRPLVEELVSAHEAGQNARVWALAEACVDRADELKREGRSALRSAAGASAASGTYVMRNGDLLTTEEAEYQTEIDTLAADIVRGY